MVNFVYCIMSDEFIKIATDEINEEISSILKILDNCQDDSDIYSNAQNIEPYLHKIKGLAPMMGKSHVGNLSAFFDNILKKIIDGKQYPGIYNVLRDSIPSMKKAMTDSDEFVEQIQKNISENLSELD